MGLKVVSYAINGRGMGHLVRQLSILRWVRRITALLDVSCECWVLTTSEADTLARREGIPALKMPSKAMLRDAGVDPARSLAILRAWVLNALAGLQPSVLVVDTFPAGSFGELVAALELGRRRVLVARQVRAEFAADPGYQALLPLYDRQILPDERGTGPILIRERSELMSREAARAALGVPADGRAVYLTLGGGGEISAPEILPRLLTALRADGWHVVVGAGPLYEGVELRGEGITWLDRYLAIELLPGVDAAVSAAGYNTFHELMFVGIPTVFLPRKRVADDQEARARRAAAAGAGRVAARWQDVPELLKDPGDPEAARGLVPHNGARAAALKVLGTVLPAEDLAYAAELLGPSTLRLLGRDGPGGARRLLKLVRVLGGAPPSTVNRTRAVLLEAGHTPAPTPDGLVERSLSAIDASGVPLDAAVSTLIALNAKFAPTPLALVEAAERLFPLWAPYADWMGVISLLRAVPRQRQLSIEAFVDGLEAWLPHEEDLYEALRAFCTLEGGGAQPVRAVLAQLGAQR